MIRRSLISLTLALAAVGLAPSAQAAQAGPIRQDHGRPQVAEPEGLILSEWRLALHLPADPNEIAGDLVLAGEQDGRDAAGAYHAWIYRPDLSAEDQARLGAGASARVWLRRYAGAGVLLATLEYQGPALDAGNALNLRVKPGRWSRGLAIHRFSPYWTAPVFASSPELLPADNVLALWQHDDRAPYHLIAPLAGDGLVGTVGMRDGRFGVSLAAGMAVTPRHVPLFAYADGTDPYALTRVAYQTAFAAAGYYGRLRWQKPYPGFARDLGWCSWNAYYETVTAKDVLASARSMRARGIRPGYMLIDDGWLSTHDRALTAYDADRGHFPGGLAAVVRQLHQEDGIRNVGVWHAFQGYWNGVAPDSVAAQGHVLLKGANARYVADPRAGAGEGLYRDWYAALQRAGIDFVKVDNQGGTGRFTDGVVPRFAAGAGAQRNVQEAAARYFSTGSGLNLLNCMEMTIENAFNWRYSNLARTSNDYDPNDRATSKDHLFQNTYNALWMSNFAYPDYDMFVTDRPDAGYHAIARAISGGPVYFADPAGHEHPEVLAPLTLPGGRLLQPDVPAEVTRDCLLVDTSLTPVPLKVSAPIRRPGLLAGMVAAFNVDKSADEVTGRVHPGDVEVLRALAENPAVKFAVLRHSDRRVFVLTGRSALPVTLGREGAELFTIVPVLEGQAVFGLLDKHMGPAAIATVEGQPHGFAAALEAPGDFGAYLAQPPRRVAIAGRTLAPAAYRFAGGLLSVPRASFGTLSGPVRLTVDW